MTGKPARASVCHVWGIWEVKDNKVLSLVKRASKKNHAALTQLCELKVKEVLFLCTREMGSAQDGQDAAQEVFIQLQKSIGNLKAPEAFNVWLNRLVYFTCQTMKRNNMKHKNALGTESFEDFLMDETLSSLPQESLEMDEKRQRIMDLIDSMPNKYRTPVVLHYYQNLRYEDIAQVMDISADAVNNNLRMARKYLKQQLDAEPVALGGGIAMLALGPLLTQAMASTAAMASTTLVAGCLGAAGVYAAAPAIGGLLAGLATQTVAQAAAVSVLALAGAGLTFGAVAALSNSSSTSLAPYSVAAGLPQSQQSGENGGFGGEGPVLAIGNTLSGRVYLKNNSEADPAALRGLAGAVIEVVSAEDPDTVLQTVGNDGLDGAFTVAGLPDGRYKLRLTLPGLAVCTKGGPAKIQGGLKTVQSGWLERDGETVFALTGDQTQLTGLDIEADLATSLSGRIQLRMGGAEIEYDEGLLPGVTIQLLDPQQRRVASSPITAQGDFMFENPMISQTGTYTLHIETDENAQVILNIPDEPVELSPGSNVRL